MNTVEFILNWLPTAIQVWILALLIKKQLYRRFPIFFVYTAGLILAGFVRASTSTTTQYFYIYWWSEVLIVALSVWAIHESFSAIFGIFYRLPWFRMLWPGVIAVVWGFGVWRAWVHPLAHFGRGRTMLMTAAIFSAYTIVGLVILFFLLVRIVRVRWHLYEFNIVYGLGLSFAGEVVALLLRSEFGTRFNWLTKWSPPLTYFLAVAVWLAALLRTEPQIKIDRPPEALLAEMQEDLKIVRRIFRKPTI